jgi:hypothetical protein
MAVQGADTYNKALETIQYLQRNYANFAISVFDLGGLESSQAAQVYS